MQHALLVSIVDGFGNRLGITRCLPGGQRPLTNDLRQILTLNEVHGEIVLSATLPDFMDRHDARMAKGASRFCLGAKTKDFLLARKLASENHLQGHGSVQADLPSPINDAHASTGD